MLDTSLKDALLASAMAIGDVITANAIINPNEIAYWRTYAGTGDDITLSTSPYIYNGNAGVILFLLELYKVSKVEKYLSYARMGLAYLEESIDQQPQTSQYSLLNGSLSFAYLYIKFSEIENHSTYVSRALKHIPSAEAITNSTVLDLLNGAAGTVLGLLHLHQATKSAKVLEVIDQSLAVFFKKAWFGKKGLYWDRSSNSVSGLCGLSHGASGIAAMFLELGFYFNNPSFYWLANQAFQYEDQYFNDQLSNWPDLRRTYNAYSTASEIHNDPDALVKHFTSYRYMNAWCHGAPGILLARMRARDLFLSHSHDTSILQCLNNELAQPNSLDLQYASLCHGVAGNAECLLKAFFEFGDDKFLDATIAAANSLILNQDKRQQEATRKFGEINNGLFLGEAGVGYFYLRLYTSGQTPSLLYPQLTKANSVQASQLNHINTPLNIIKLDLVKRFFRRTIDTARVLSDTEINFSNELNSEIVSETKECLAKMIESSLPQNQPLLHDVYKFEKQILEIDHSTHGDLYTTYLAHSTKNRAAQYVRKGSQPGLNSIVVRNHLMTVVNSRWNWKHLGVTAGTDLHDPSPNESTYLCIPTINGVVIQAIDSEDALLIKTCSKELSLNELLDSLTAICEDTGSQEEQDAILKRVHRLLSAGVITLQEQ